MALLRALVLISLGSLLATQVHASPPAADAGSPPAKIERTLYPESQKQAWLTRKLIGGDNRMAARRAVQIEARDGRYSIFIKNQFALRCWVEFDSAGDPTQLSECKSGDSAEWDATGPITLTCREQPRGRICSGKWNSRNGIIAPDTLSIQRIDGQSAPKPPSATKRDSAPKQAERDCHAKGTRCLMDTVVSDDF